MCILKLKEKFNCKKKIVKTKEQQDEEFFNGEEYIITSTMFHYKNPVNSHRTQIATEIPVTNGVSTTTNSMTNLNTLTKVTS